MQDVLLKLYDADADTRRRAGGHLRKLDW